MSGLGKRLVDAGYTQPKPLILVNGKPIIEYVVSMFPGENDFIFICNNEHLENTDMRSVLERIKPTGKIFGLDTHNQGPVYAVSKIFDEIDDNEDVFVSYCDYFMDFDFNEFKKIMKEGDFSGAVLSYTGFHPHLLKPNIYAGVEVNENGTMTNIKEKHSFTEDKTKSYHSAGAYYFKNGSDFKNYTKELLDSDIRLNGEAYTSMMYYLYLRDGHKIYVPIAKKFMQWGTPEDLEEFESWSRYLNKKLCKEKGKTSIPKEREHLVKIPYEEGSENFIKSEKYWEEYFKNI